jgi:hypothetical protein
MVRMLPPRLPLAQTTIVRLPRQNRPTPITSRPRGGSCDARRSSATAAFAPHRAASAWPWWPTTLSPARRAARTRCTTPARFAACTTIGSAKIRPVSAERGDKGFIVAPAPSAGNRAPQHAQNFFAATNRFQQVAKIKGRGGREKARKCRVFWALTLDIFSLLY